MVEIQYDNDILWHLDTLAANDVTMQASSIDASRSQGFRVAKSRIFATFTGKTAAEGPLVWGVAANLDATQLEQILEADPQDKMAETRRADGMYFKTLGIIQSGDTSGFLTPDGQAVEVTPNWSIPEGEGLFYWVYNQGGASLTTGTYISIFAEHYGVWLRD